MCQMRMLLLTLACKTNRSKYTDTGEGVKNGKILRTSLMYGPLLIVNIIINTKGAFKD